MRVTAAVLAVALIGLCATLSAEDQPPAARPLHWQYTTEGGLGLVSVDRDASGTFAVIVAKSHLAQEFEYTIPRYGDGRLYRHHVWEIWKMPPRMPATHLGVRDFDAPSRYHRIVFFAATKRGTVPQWLEVREGYAGVIVEVTTVLP